MIELVRFVFRLAGEVDLELGERIFVGAGENNGRVRLAPGKIVERLHRPRGDRIADGAHRERDERFETLPL